MRGKIEKNERILEKDCCFLTNFLLLNIKNYLFNYKKCMKCKYFCSNEESRIKLRKNCVIVFGSIEQQANIGLLGLKCFLQIFFRTLPLECGRRSSLGAVG